MIEAMKQALEALEDFVDVIKYDNEQDDIGRRACCDVLSYNPHSESCKAKQAITAIKEAIREHAMYEVQRLGQEIEQEPVAMEIIYETIIQWDESGGKRSRRELARRIIDLYTHPPQRTWQNFCPRCGKRTNDIHTCTPPTEKNNG
jgi:hypothetical protein